MPKINIRTVEGKLLDSWEDKGHDIVVGKQLKIASHTFEVTGVAKRNKHTEVNVKPVKAA